MADSTGCVFSAAISDPVFPGFPLCRSDRWSLQRRPAWHLIDVPADGRQGFVHLFISRIGMFSRVSPSGQSLLGYKYFSGLGKGSLKSKIASGYSLAVLAVVSPQPFHPLLILQFTIFKMAIWFLKWRLCCNIVVSRCRQVKENMA